MLFFLSGLGGFRFQGFRVIGVPLRAPLRDL